MEINLTVIIKSKPEHTEELKLLLKNLVDNSRKEAACIQYDLHQNTENPKVFIFHEVWKNKEGHDLHKKQPHFKQFINASVDFLDEEPMVYATTKIG